MWSLLVDLYVKRPGANVHAKISMKNELLFLKLDALQTSKGRLSRQMVDERAFK